ncbi:hypothetical protein KR200_007733 [Drosophila serrata]|nr:hypothetical protein KR200_007733 [Drosophila serrata]
MGRGTELSAAGSLWIGVFWLMAGAVASSSSDDVLRCFQCSESDISCGSPRNPLGNVLECPNSTMCSYTERTLVLNGREWTKTLRGCANQVQRTVDLVNRKWEFGYEVKGDQYEEGCVRKDKVNYCHCRGSLCNSSSFSKLDFRLLIFASIVIVVRGIHLLLLFSG